LTGVKGEKDEEEEEGQEEEGRRVGGENGQDDEQGRAKRAGQRQDNRERHIVVHLQASRVAEGGRSCT
jgi:hypothetical protein